jgi:hypothetical protein
MSIIVTLSILFLIGYGDRLPEPLRVEPEVWLASGTVGAALIAFLGLVLAVWKYRVLRRPDIRSLFKPGSRPDRDAP